MGHSVVSRSFAHIYFGFSEAAKSVIFFRAPESKSKGRTDTFSTDQIDVFLMGTDDLADDGQAQACPFFVLAAGEVGLVEAVPDQFLVFFANSDSAVANGDKYCISFFCCINGDLGVLMAEFQGVVDQVVEDLLDLFQVRIDKEDLSGQDQSDMYFLCAAGLFKRSRNRAYDSIDVKICSLQQNTAGVEVVES